MIAPILSVHDNIIADFWVQAWQVNFPEIDFEARRPWIMEHLATMRAEQHVMRAFYDASVPVGFYTLFPECGLVEQICVSPTAHRRGIGALLVGDAALHTPNTLNLVVNESNQIARRFYEKLGFRETGRGVNLGSSQPVVRLEMAVKQT